MMQCAGCTLFLPYLPKEKKKGAAATINLACHICGYVAGGTYSIAGA